MDISQILYHPQIPLVKTDGMHVNNTIDLPFGENVVVAARSGVTKNILDNKTVAGFPAKDISLWKKEIIRSAIKKWN